MKIVKTLLAGSAALAALAAAPASAALLNFDFTGGYSASFQLDSDIQPTRYDDHGAAYDDISGTFGGKTYTSNIFSIFQSSDGGGVAIYLKGGEPTLADMSGDQVFSGSLAAPKFNLGVFNLTENTAGKAVTLTISAVPEPATWALMMVGFGMVAGAARYRRRNTSVRFA